MCNRMLFLLLIPWLSCWAGASEPDSLQRETSRGAEVAGQEADQARQEAHRARQEADQARREADQARHEADQTRRQAEETRREADQARREMAEARQELAEAARRLAEAQRRLATERGDAVGPVFFHRAPAMSFEGLADDKRYSILFRPGPGQPPPRSWIGVVLGDDQQAGGVTVAGLTPGGPARKAGLERGDRIVSFNGHPLDGAHELRELLGQTDPGETVTLEVLRGDERLQFNVEATAPGMPLGIDLEDLKLRLEQSLPHTSGLFMPGGEAATFQGLHDMTIRLPAMAMTLGPGSNLVANHDGLAPYFGTAEGILVVRIGADNPFGLKSGDVILKINDQLVDRPADIARQLMSIEPGDAVILDIIREGRDQTLDAQMPERPMGRIGALFRNPKIH